MKIGLVLPCYAPPWLPKSRGCKLKRFLYCDFSKSHSQSCKKPIFLKSLQLSVARLPLSCCAAPYSCYHDSGVSGETTDCSQIYDIPLQNGQFANVRFNLYERVLTPMRSPLCWSTLRLFSAAVDSHTTSFPSRGMENDDRKALTGRATFSEKWLRRL